MVGTLAQCVEWLYAQDPTGRYEVKEKRPRRSLTQNAYYWAMLNRLARALGMADSEVHLHMLREYGVCEVLRLSARVPVGDYFDHYDVLYEDREGGEPWRVVKVYKGSSRMDSAEFSRLVNGMREECEAQGIDVATPEEVARMRFVEPERRNA